MPNLFSKAKKSQPVKAVAGKDEKTRITIEDSSFFDKIEKLLTEKARDENFPQLKSKYNSLTDFYPNNKPMNTARPVPQRQPYCIRWRPTFNVALSSVPEFSNMSNVGA